MQNKVLKAIYIVGGLILALLSIMAFFSMLFKKLSIELFGDDHELEELFSENEGDSFEPVIVCDDNDDEPLSI